MLEKAFGSLIASGYIEMTLYAQMIILAAIAVFVFSQRKAPAYMRLIALSCLSEFIVFASLTLANREFAIRMYEVRTWYHAVNLILIYLVYYTSAEKVSNGVFRLLFITFLSFIIFSSFLFEKAGSFHRLVKILSSVAIASLSLAYFYLLLAKSKALPIHNLPMFWFNAGIFIYYGGVLWIFSVSEGLSASEENTTMMNRLFDSLIGLAKQLLIVVAVFKWKNHDKQKKTD